MNTDISRIVQATSSLGIVAGKNGQLRQAFSEDAPGIFISGDSADRLVNAYLSLPEELLTKVKDDAQATNLSSLAMINLGVTQTDHNYRQKLTPQASGMFISEKEVVQQVLAYMTIPEQMRKEAESDPVLAFHIVNALRTLNIQKQITDGNVQYRIQPSERTAGTFISEDGLEDMVHAFISLPDIVKNDAISDPIVAFKASKALVDLGITYDAKAERYRQRLADNAAGSFISELDVVVSIATYTCLPQEILNLAKGDRFLASKLVKASNDLKLFKIDSEDEQKGYAVLGTPDRVSIPKISSLAGEGARAILLTRGESRVGLGKPLGYVVTVVSPVQKTVTAEEATALILNKVYPDVGGEILDYNCTEALTRLQSTTQFEQQAFGTVLRDTLSSIISGERYKGNHGKDWSSYGAVDLSAFELDFLSLSPAERLGYINQTEHALRQAGIADSELEQGTSTDDGKIIFKVDSIVTPGLRPNTNNIGLMVLRPGQDKADFVNVAVPSVQAYELGQTLDRIPEYARPV